MKITINDGKIREYDVNVKLEHKIYSQIYTILLDLKNNKKHLDIHLKNIDINKLCDSFWDGKDIDIVD